MNLIEIPDAGIRVYMPSELAECDARQYIEMCGLIFNYYTGQLEFDDFLTHSVYKLLDIKMTEKKFSETDEVDLYSNITMLSDLILEFFEESEEKQMIIKQNYINNPVPSFKPLLTEFYGPSDAFNNMKYGEYTDALRTFHEFHATQEISHLYTLAAMLYRPMKKNYPGLRGTPDDDGDIREKYNSNLVEARADKFREIMPIGFIYGVFMFFASFQKFIVSARVPWGGRELDLSILFEGGEESTSEHPGLGMDSLTFSMAESGAFGDVDKLRFTPLWEILIRMYDLRIRDIENKKQQSKTE